MIWKGLSGCYGLSWIWTVLSCDCFIIKTLKQPFNLFWLKSDGSLYHTDQQVSVEHLCWSELWFFLNKKKNGFLRLTFCVCAFHSAFKESIFLLSLAVIVSNDVRFILPWIIDWIVGFPPLALWNRSIFNMQCLCLPRNPSSWLQLGLQYGFLRPQGCFPPVSPITLPCCCIKLIFKFRVPGGEPA